VTLSWSAASGLRAQRLTIDVIAPARADMTLEELRQAHLAAAHDVLGSALLRLEDAECGFSPEGLGTRAAMTNRH